MTLSAALVPLVFSRSASSSADGLPTWDRVAAFLRSDPIDEREWRSPYYICTDFARDLKQNANAAGLKAASVVIRTGSGANHHINAFATSDRGLVFIEPQEDAVAHVVIGELFMTRELGSDAWVKRAWGIISKIDLEW